MIPLRFMDFLVRFWCALCATVCEGASMAEAPTPTPWHRFVSGVLSLQQYGERRCGRHRLHDRCAYMRFYIYIYIAAVYRAQDLIRPLVSVAVSVTPRRAERIFVCPQRCAPCRSRKMRIRKRAQVIARSRVQIGPRNFRYYRNCTLDTGRRRVGGV